eukprot:TRINITY_DN2039_c0_g1_i1.p2 TRINITY_DN2039_c0_g1~~TRINITY_DN2039_c0_g1_i1.p2  ORF type:complete len:173 (-),score=29.20 TRINITY_DN2039_c0_g1_i1:83-601(-)
MGRIGQSLVRKVVSWQMKIVYYQRNRVSEELEKELGATYVSLDELLRDSDFISIHTALTTETRHLIGAPQLAQMKKNAYLINTSRGAVVDESALVEALKSGHLAGAGLDVFEEEPKVHPELLQMRNVTLLPHIGSGTIEDRSEMFNVCLRNVEAVLEGRPPINPVNNITTSD